MSSPIRIVRSMCGFRVLDLPQLQRRSLCCWLRALEGQRLGSAGCRSAVSPRRWHARCRARSFPQPFPRRAIPSNHGGFGALPAGLQNRQGGEAPRLEGSIPSPRRRRKSPARRDVTTVVAPEGGMADMGQRRIVARPARAVIARRSSDRPASLHAQSRWPGPRHKTIRCDAQR